MKQNTRKDYIVLLILIGVSIFCGYELLKRSFWHFGFSVLIGLGFVIYFYIVIPPFDKFKRKMENKKPDEVKTRFLSKIKVGGVFGVTIIIIYLFKYGVIDKKWGVVLYFIGLAVILPLIALFFKMSSYEKKLKNSKGKKLS